ncbi:gephyrin-like molybdotransferase receptor GlpR [Amycolatopsis suaedae]|uniref:Uncharacterized protein n=1 Tax=Amycolatopsis suaedae TaxID=2510978 RepID=A0A4Q7J6Y1_9PSEU|nr:gephyrin-like molybdotransferase receptor GlpR [Amycolatopsis suaedae]RZQ63411.1 hypothetical protein EWH70_13265 [Amycolatopsis suaedae]
MPSSLIIVALAAAWLVVLVPMIARKRQEIARTADSALAARVVRSGSTRNEGREEFSMADTVQPDEHPDDRDDLEAVEEPEPREEAELPPLPQPRPDNPRRYRPGRGGFDPEAAEIAAKAKYAFRQRVVIILLVLAVVTAGLAGFLLPLLWWVHGAVDLTLIGYLVYLRRQVRIENEIRERRMARMSGSRPVRRAPSDDVEVTRASAEIVGSERKPSPTSRMRRQAAVVDPEDEDPAFHDLEEPGQAGFRRAAGE